ncbi:N-formylglutamate amidohydrolase [Leptospira sp. GIMC2001]|uniref:N-formylglutamate amidohydrolase n=1 Tax=Leptospira sp. GIMC2001 TaxID=1513297 RepID=UPI00234B1546|nr:N-formylglutamate amidohydrolase [Leptospira sp. GIMC2001]WCL49978.1 N-formylglutamate amidohydrolase [Leptospira sp. GIMC2001]
MKEIVLIFTCEHYSNSIPTEYRSLFKGKEDILKTHRAWDIGAPIVLDRLTRVFGETPWQADISRLIVDLNRSEGHKNLFSEFTKPLPKQEKISILDYYYYPYRERFESEIVKLTKTFKKVVHIAIHTFTPELNNEIRNAEIGILYDPSHKIEAEFCKIWTQNLKHHNQNHLRIRSNYPYHGKSNSLPTYLRRKYRNYIGIELELNQSLFSLNGKQIIDRKVIDILVNSIQDNLENYKLIDK